MREGSHPLIHGSDDVILLRTGALLVGARIFTRQVHRSGEEPAQTMAQTIRPGAALH